MKKKKKKGLLSKENKRFLKLQRKLGNKERLEELKSRFAIAGANREASTARALEQAGLAAEPEAFGSQLAPFTPTLTVRAPAFPNAFITEAESSPLFAQPSFALPGPRFADPRGLLPPFAPLFNPQGVPFLQNQAFQTQAFPQAAPFFQSQAFVPSAEAPFTSLPPSVGPGNLSASFLEPSLNFGQEGFISLEEQNFIEADLQSSVKKLVDTIVETRNAFRKPRRSKRQVDDAPPSQTVSLTPAIASPSPRTASLTPAVASLAPSFKTVALVGGALLALSLLRNSRL